ncbi:MAG: AI-2E family transporter [Clostridia bacterium]|nr:AI-2E family transporter [Bacillota bacterium]MBO2520664.1 AI-2E family transporter [Bacillota bacterium]
MSRRGKILILAGFALLIGLFLYRVREALTPFFLALAVAYLGYPLVKALERREVPRVVAILLMYAMFAAAAVLLVYAVLPSLERELQLMMELLPGQMRRLEALFRDVLRGVRRIPLPSGLEALAGLAVQRVEALLHGVAARAAEALVAAFSHLFNLILAPFLAYYILRDLDDLAKTAVSWLPAGARRDVLELASRVHRAVGGFVRGQLIVSLAVGLLIALGLSLLGVRYALILGLLAGLFDIIPYFGPILGAVPAVAFALLRSPLTALWTLLLFVAVQQLEGSLLSPKVVGEQVGLHPLTVIFSVLAGGELLGVAGMLLAVPFAAAVKVTAGFVGEKLMGESG